MRARCWSKPRGRLFEGPGRFGHSTNECAVGVERTWLRLPSPARLQSLFGICSPATRTTPGFAPRCMPRSCATLSYGLVSLLGVASVVQATNTTSQKAAGGAPARRARRSRIGGSRKAGQSAGSLRLRMPQRRRDNKDSAAEASPPTRLFVTRSSTGLEKITCPHERGYLVSRGSILF